VTDAGVFEVTDHRVEQANAETYAAMVAMHRADVDGERILEDIKPLLAEDRRRAMNVDKGYWVASFDEHVVGHAQTGAFDGVREVWMATDGFMRSVRPFGIFPDVRTLVCESRPFEETKQRLRDVENSDLDTNQFPRWSISDDVCAQRLVWVPGA
jgi:hypothetical protein